MASDPGIDAAMERRNPEPVSRPARTASLPHAGLHRRGGGPGSAVGHSLVSRAEPTALPSKDQLDTPWGRKPPEQTRGGRQGQSERSTAFGCDLAGPLSIPPCPAYIWSLPLPAPHGEGRFARPSLEGALLALVALFAATLFAVYVSSQLAIAKNRNATGWMWSSALFPPTAMVLAALPVRRAAARGDSA